METQVATRRMTTIAGHFATADEVSAAAVAVVPMNCSGGLRSVIRRSDNRMNYARQGSSSQACFMRQASTDQATVPLKSSVPASGAASEAPLFSRPAKMDSRCRQCAAPESPKFARPNRGTGRQCQQSGPKKELHAFESSGCEQSRRMDVAETRSSYILTLELAGVSNNDIIVEVGNKMLSVRGRKSNRMWRMATLSDDDSSYHNREIPQGLYHIAWPLPTNSNKDGVSAELVDGLLQITIPKQK